MAETSTDAPVGPSEHLAREMLRASGMTEHEVNDAIETLRTADPLCFMASDLSMFSASHHKS